MHIPDGYLSTRVWAVTDVVSAPVVMWIARRAQAKFDYHRIPLLGIMGAFVFAAQMINFPVGNGTSGHLVGSALLACTLGPSAAAIVITAILATQALLFQDGGLLALGANVFNMAIAGVFAGYLPYLLFRGRRWSLFAAGFVSVMTSALLALGELLISGVTIPNAMLGISIGLFAISAAAEGAITMAVAAALERIQPGCLQRPVEVSKRVWGLVGAAAAALAGLGGLIASGAPDGLESLARRIGLQERPAIYTSPLSDYRAGFINSTWLAKCAAGLTGIVVIYFVCVLLLRGMAATRATVLADREGA